MTMKNIHKQQILAKSKYDAGGYPFKEIEDITCYCLTKLPKEASHRLQASIASKKYSVFVSGINISRPYLPNLFISSDKEFRKEWKKLINSCDKSKNLIDATPQFINKVLYTVIMSFSICYDLWKSTSRKTPGTYFEVLLGSLIGEIIPKYIRTKHISLKNFQEKVSTDIVFTNKNTSKGLVIPVKITTRERIVQPFAHQRILESVYGKGKFKSILVCVSEMQRDGDSGVNEICVPGTIKLFQTHLSTMTGIYYLDPPKRYLEKDLLQVINISSLGALLSKDLPKLIP